MPHAVPWLTTQCLLAVCFSLFYCLIFPKAIKSPKEEPTQVSETKCFRPLPRPIAPEETTPEKKENQDGTKVSRGLNRGKSSAFLGEEMEMESLYLLLENEGNTQNHGNDEKTREYATDDAKTELDGRCLS